MKSIKKGSVILVSSVAMPGDPGSAESITALDKITGTLSGNSIAGLPLLSSTVTVKGGSTSTGDSNPSSLGIILGVTIPLGILLIVGVIVFIVYKSKSTEEYKYSTNGNTDREK